MRNNIILLLCSVQLLCSCARDPSGYLKKSANNQYFDARGMHGKKRRPNFNSKYIEQAKKNIYNKNYEEDQNDDEYADELENPASFHRNMYRHMLEQEQKKRLGQKIKKPKDKAGFPKLREAKDRTANDVKLHKDHESLRKEMYEMRKLLKAVKEDLEQLQTDDDEIITQEKKSTQPKTSNYPPAPPVQSTTQQKTAETTSNSENISAKMLNEADNNANKEKENTKTIHSAKLLNESFETNDDVAPQGSYEDTAKLLNQEFHDKNSNWLL